MPKKSHSIVGYVENIFEKQRYIVCRKYAKKTTKYTMLKISIKRHGVEYFKKTTQYSMSEKYQQKTAQYSMSKISENMSYSMSKKSHSLVCQEYQKESHSMLNIPLCFSPQKIDKTA